ncbi:MAG: glycosyltransferase [Chloroflexi bacterium]|nr:glycosyltransferase [Chloroflexota bacterium]
MRIALFSPLSPLQTAIADHVEGLLPYLAEFAEMDLFIDDGYVPSNPTVRSNFVVHNYRDFPNLASQYDIAVYHMGNEPNYHGYIYHMLRQYPGIVVLHDLVLHHCIYGLTVAKGDIEGYLAEMRYSYGREGEIVATQIVEGRNPDLMYRYPLMERVLDSSRGVIVHNNYALHQVWKKRPKLPAVCIPQHFYLPDGLTFTEDRKALRERFGLEGRFVVASYGILGDKHLNITLRAFSRFRRTFPEAVYLLVGPIADDVVSLVRSLGLEDVVRIVGWQDPIHFVRYMLVADLAIQLKYPHVGGTPYTPIRLLGLGIPTIISNIEPLAEIPENCCARVDLGGTEEDELLVIMEYLATHEASRQEMAENGRRYVQENHDPRKVALQYKRFIERTLSTPARVAPGIGQTISWQERLIEDVATILAEWGISADDDHLLLPIAEAIASLGFYGEEVLGE